MKLFGGKKGGMHSMNAVQGMDNHVVENAEAEQTDVLDVAEIAAQTLAPEVTPTIEIVPEIVEAEAEAEAEAEQVKEETQEDGLISSIAEAFGISPEEVQNENQEIGSGSDEQIAEPEKKLTRKEKKAAKKAEKAAAKQAKKDEKAAAKKAKKEARKWSLGKKILVSLIVIFALGLTGFAGYFVQEMWVTDDTLDIYEADFTGEIIHAGENSDILVGEDVGEQTQAAPVDETRKEGCYTFLVAARDVESGCTDVIIVGRFDTKNHTINMVSIPRDTMINKGNLKINTAYQGDLSSGGNGVDGLMKEMKKILGFEIDSYAIVDIEAVEKLIDAIGGVYFDVPMDMVYRDGAQNLDINIKKGYQKLSGSDAVKVLRFRKGYANGDLGRINVQHDFIKALAEQMLDIGNIPNLGAAIEIYQEHVQSNLTAGMLLFYAKHFLDMSIDGIQFIDMPQMRGGIVNNQSFIWINPAKWVPVINEYLNPYKQDITQRNLNIKFSSDEGQTFGYTGG